MQSHPMWVRGLKQTLVVRKNPAIGVAPYVGAWIETLHRLTLGLHLTVAPYVGAWIETFATSSRFRAAMSHPMWVRGLKLADGGETFKIESSHPMWVRGLKPFL